MVRLTADARRAQIIEAALPLFADRGLSSVTTKEVAEAAGVSEALLYRHFSGKDDLFQTVAQHCIDMATAQVDILEQLPNNTETLVICVYALMWKIQSADAEKTCFKKLLHNSLHSDPAFYRRFLEGTSRPWVAKMRLCIDAAIACGDVLATPEDAELSVWLGHHMSVTICHYRLADVEILEYPGGSDHLLGRSVEFVLRGMRLTEDAIERYYRPDSFQLLLQQKID